MAYLNLTGKITRLYVTKTSCKIHLDSFNSDYLELEKTHGNYDSIFSMLFTAFVEGLNVRLRMDDYNLNDPPALTVSYIVMDS